MIAKTSNQRHEPRIGTEDQKMLRIDAKLKSLGWIIVPYSERMNTSGLIHHAVEE